MSEGGALREKCGLSGCWGFAWTPDEAARDAICGKAKQAQQRVPSNQPLLVRHRRRKMAPEYGLRVRAVYSRGDGRFFKPRRAVSNSQRSVAAGLFRSGNGNRPGGSPASTEWGTKPVSRPGPDGVGISDRDEFRPELQQSRHLTIPK